MSFCVPHLRLLLIAFCSVLAWLWSPQVFGQDKDKIRQAFIDLRDDNVKYNCSRATFWLFKRRDALRDQLLEELYRTNDPQERDSLLLILFHTPSFSPDERFARFVVQRLREEDTRVYSFFLGLPSDESDPAEREMDPDARAHHVAWKFIDKHYALFEPILKTEIADTNDMWELWGIAWIMKKHNVLAANSSLFTPDVLNRAAAALKSDNVAYNACEAIRLFFMLTRQSMPVLRGVANSSDPQQRSLARAWLDALGGNKNGFGYLNSKVTPYRGLLPGGDRPEPEWLFQVTQPYLDKDTYP